MTDLRTGHNTTVNLGEMETDVQNRLEEQGGLVRWSKADIDGAINEGIQELSDATEFYERYFTLQLRNFASYYDLRTVCPDTILRVTACFNQSNNLWLKPEEVKELDYKVARQWELVQGEPTRYFMRGLWWFGVYPAGPSTQGILKIYYRAIHPNLVSSSDSPQQLPDDYHNSLVDYAVYTLLADDIETTQAMQFWNRYKAAEIDLARQSSAGGRLGSARIGNLGTNR